jgi:hypothetical protein
MLRTLAILAALVVASALAPLARADDPTRVLRSFDFEERERGNVEDVPMDWVKVEGPGLPHYVNGMLTTEAAHAGRTSFRFDLDGGSLIYRYPSGKIRVHANANYRIGVRVRADAMPNARARLTAYFANVDGRPLRDTVRHADPYAGGAPGWHLIQMDVEAGDDAAWLVLELGLVQPSMWRSSTLGRQKLFEQDIRATAYFDDLVVAQVPRARMSTDRPGNVFRRSEPIALRVRISDRLTDDLACRLLVVDAAGRQAYQLNGQIPLVRDPGVASADGEIAKVGSIALPDLPAGWYRASMQLLSQGVVVGDESLDLVRLADEGQPVEPDKRFGVIATHLPNAGWSELPTLLPYLGVARVKLSVWDSTGDVESQQLKFALLLESLRELQIVPTACLASPSPKVAAGIGGSSWANIVKAQPEAWQPQLSFLVSRHAGYLDRWQFGVDDQATEFVSNPAMRQAYDAVYQQFEKLIDKPDLAMPWPAFFEAEGKLPATVALSVPSEVLPSQIPLYIQDLKQREARDLSLSLQLLPDSYGRDARLRDFVQRIAYALSGGATRVDLPLPFDSHAASGSVVKQPSELLLVMRTLMQTLGNAAYVGRVPVGEDVEALLFDRRGEGVLLMWSKAGVGVGGQTPERTVEIVLGKSPRRVDLWGNVSPVLQPKNASGVIEVSVGPTPMMLVGIDGRLAQMRSSFAFDNPLLESSFKPHVRRLRFANTTDATISGRIRLAGPAGWTVVAQQPNFMLAPGESYDGAVTIEFPYNSFAGVKQIECDVQTNAGEGTSFKVPVALKLGLGDVGLSTIALRDGRDLLVQQVITNYSDKPVDYTSFVVVPNQARQERLVQGLKAGQTTIKKYRFTNVEVPRAQDVQRVRSGLKELEGTRVLNDEVVVQ